MTKQALPAVSTLTSDTLEEFKTQDKVVVVAYFASDDKTSNETFSKVADSMRDDFLFGATNDVALAEAAGVKQPGLVMYKDFDDGATTFDAKFTAEAVEDFIKSASIPLVGEIGPETYAGYMAVSPSDRRKLAESTLTLWGSDRSAPCLYLC
jgi:protein disulfide-isomerase A1